MQSLINRLALVTGASSGIGASTARALHAAGATMVLAARRRDRLEALAAELSGAEVLELDVRDAAAVQGALGGREFDIAVNNAGLALGVEPLQEGDPEEWKVVVDTNVTGVLNVLQATLPAMVRRGRGDHVFLGSVAGRQVYPGGAVYCATKHAVRAIYEGARQDATHTGVRFTSVDPGLVQTDFSRVRFRGDRERAEAIYAGLEPLLPEDVADAVLWALTRPPRVNVGEIVMWASAQTSTTRVRRATDESS